MNPYSTKSSGVMQNVPIDTPPIYTLPSGVVETAPEAIPQYYPNPFGSTVLDAVLANTSAKPVPVVNVNNAMSFVRDNIWLIGGVALVAGYFIFMRGGLSASDRSVVSTTRYTPSK